MNIMLHSPTIEHVRSLLASSRAELPVASEDISIRGAAVIAHDVMISIDGMLAGLVAPVCASCAAKARGEAA